MSEKPILFSTEMVQAILIWRKTQTRRVVKPQPEKIGAFTKFAWGAGTSENTMPVFAGFSTESKCPYGKIGDLLWVRESFCPDYFDKGHHPSLNAYKADWNDTAAEYCSKPKWKPSIHMPKSAARIWLKVTKVRVERLHQITEEDALKEGALIGRVWGYGHIGGSHREGFIKLWERINGWDSWLANPWVWVIEFEVISTTGRP